MKLPSGVRDWLPEELERKRAIESALRALFARWSYREVQTPTFERFDVLEAGLGVQLEGQTFRFSDRSAATLALRPEMTTPIARLVSTRLRDAPLPLRLSYVAPVYRYEDPQEGRMREFTQAGVELIGRSSVEADSEALLMAIEALDVLDLRDSRFDINDASVVDGVLEGVGLSAPDAHACKVLLSERNVVALRAKLNEAHAGPQAVQSVLELAMARGTERVLELAGRVCRSPASRQGIERLQAIADRAAAQGHAHRVTIDFALLRDLEYYTGFVFEGYVGDLGFSLCGGGRYDSLLPRFGYDVGAVGWMLGVERILSALERRQMHREHA